MISIDKDTNPRGGQEKKGAEVGRGTCPLVLKNARTLRCSYFSIPFGCRKRDRDTTIPDNPCKLARSFLIKFIELMRDLFHDIAASTLDDLPQTFQEFLRFFAIISPLFV